MNLKFTFSHDKPNLPTSCTKGLPVAQRAGVFEPTTMERKKEIQDIPQQQNRWVTSKVEDSSQIRLPGFLFFAGHPQEFFFRGYDNTVKITWWKFFQGCFTNSIWHIFVKMFQTRSSAMTNRDFPTSGTVLEMKEATSRS